ncbi:MAG: hypothetical protein WCV86_02965 [Patescibacteria group bacterium]|jgi:hypothetical protein
MFEGVQKEEEKKAVQPQQQTQGIPPSGLRPKKADVQLPSIQTQGEKEIPPETLDALKRAGLDALEDEHSPGRFMVFLIAAAVILVGGMLVILLFANPFRSNETTNTIAENTNISVNTNANSNTNSGVNGNTNSTAGWITYSSSVLGFSVDYPPTWKVDRARSTEDEVVFTTGIESVVPEAISAVQTSQSLTEWQNLLLVTNQDAIIIDTSALRIAGFATIGIDTQSDEGTFLAFTNGRMRYVFQTGGAMLENGMLSTFALLSSNTNSNTNTDVNTNANGNLNANTNISPTIDTDRDGLPDAQEEALGTNPLVADTDRDDLADYQEVIVYGSDPLDPDTDGDGFTDGQEVKNNFNPVGSGNLSAP